MPTPIASSAKKIEVTTAQQTMFALWSIAIAAAALFILLVVGLVMITRRLVTPLGAMGDASGTCAPVGWKSYAENDANRSAGISAIAG